MSCNRLPALVFAALALGWTAAAAAQAQPPQPAQPPQEEAKLLDEIVAVVEDEAITRSDVAEQLQLYLLELQIDPETRPAAVDSLQREVFRQLVESLLIIKEAERKGVKVNEEEVNRYLERQIEEMRTRLGGEEAFQRQLAQEGVTEKKLREFYREDFRRQLLTSQLVRAELNTDVEVTDAEIQEYYAAHKSELPPKKEQVHLRHLVIRPKPSPEREAGARDKIQQALDRVRGGEDFATVAREVSQDPTAQRGGDMGWFGRGDLADTLFTQAAFALPDSAISDIVRSGYGFHVIQRLGTRGDQINVRHIVIPHQVNDDDMARARAIADEVKTKLASGASFVDLIRKYSDEKTNDGDAGYFPMDGLYPTFRTAIEGLPAGQVSDAIQDRQGFHFLQVIERIAPSEYAFEEIAPQIRELLSREKLTKQYRAWVDKLRERSYVDIRWNPDARTGSEKAAG